MLAVAACLGFTGTAMAENHNFAGTYSMNAMYQPVDGDLDAGYLPLVINAQNVVTQFGNYELSFMSMMGWEIVGDVEDNTFTFSCPITENLLILDATPSGHYLVLSGYDSDDQTFQNLPVTLSYNPDYDDYEINFSLAVWDFDPVTKEATLHTVYMIFGISIDEGGEVETADPAGTFTVAGNKTVYTNGVAGEPQAAEFTMTIQDDGSGDYEFTEFGGYTVGNTPKGWLGVYGPFNNNVLEIQGNAINSDASNGLIAACPYAQFDDLYVVAISFTNNDEGTVSNFGIWKTVNGQPTELLEVWSNLEFVRGESGSVKGIESEIIPSDESPIYYDLSGRRIANPSNGLFIIKQGNKTQKVLINK